MGWAYCAAGPIWFGMSVSLRKFYFGWNIFIHFIFYVSAVCAVTATKLTCKSSAYKSKNLGLTQIQKQQDLAESDINRAAVRQCDIS